MQDYTKFSLLEQYPNIDFDYLRDLNEDFNFLCESVEITDELKEGLIGKVVGALGGAWLGPKIGKAICKVLGIQSGLLYNFLTSTAVNAALGYEIGKTATSK